jgi:hypothetical protein
MFAEFLKCSMNSARVRFGQIAWRPILCVHLSALLTITLARAMRHLEGMSRGATLSDFMAELHNRMPVILDSEDFDWWPALDVATPYAVYFNSLPFALAA